MNNILKKPYEISLWDDVLVFLVKFLDKETGVEVKQEEYIGSLEGFTNPEGYLTEVTQYYKEQKICTIGSNTMDTPVRAFQPKLVSNINGSNTLTFSMYYRYYDEQTNEFYDNPFLDLLVNERKIKLRYGALGSEDCKWYDLIVKNIQENSENKTFVYTAKDMFINELSKSGFELEFNSELENNTGNVTYLAEKVLDGSDWELDVESSDILQQKKEEPLYLLTLSSDIVGVNMLDESDTIAISSGENVYAFYSVIENKESYFQFLYVDGEYARDDDHIITNSKNYFIENVQYDDETGLPSFASHMVISNDLRGERLVRKARTEYDGTIDKYVSVYTAADGNEYYGYTESEYISPAAVTSFVTNPTAYSSYTGWEIGGAQSNNETQFPEFDLVSVPDVRDISSVIDQTFKSYLKYKQILDGQYLFNSGIADKRSTINGFAANEEYIFRIKLGEAIINEYDRPTQVNPTTAPVVMKVASYTLSNGVYELENVYFESTLTTLDDDGYHWGKVKCKVALPYSQMIKTKLGLFISLPLNTTYCIEDVQFFPYLLDANDNMCIPGGELVSAVKTKYFYYIPSEDYESIDDVQYVYQGYSPSTAYSQVYNDNQFEKVRSITASESNRFNLIQNLCEIFECWARFRVEHNPETGEILLDENYRQKKSVSFHEYIGKDNDCGFKYGINLKSIQRTLNSDGIVSKIIVKPNSNEFGENGFCTIARATENPTGENFIYDFSYYIQHELIGFSEINNDLYTDVNGYLGYYKKLKELNSNREIYIEEQTALLADIAEYESSFQTYSVSVDEANAQLRDEQVYIKTFTGYTFEQLIADKTIDWWNSNETVKMANNIAQLKSIIANHTTLRDEAERNLNAANERYTELQELLEKIIKDKKELSFHFYKKYSRFIQEGSWISEDYIDDNLYYLDAESTLHTSSQPQVNYTINVLELSQLEDYENYIFSLGDKTFVEDTEFFGWYFDQTSGLRTPYKEEIVVTELTIALDSPEQNVVKVQNYKTQFEDLFQRIAATTQTIEYSTGRYNKASNVVQEDGTIPITTLQNSLVNNALTLSNARDQSVIWDETGITTTSLSAPNEMVRIVSGGIFLSTDGGVVWNTGVTGRGINANYITTGQLNTSEVNILNGSFPSFRWDGVGLSAYSFSVNQETGEPVAFDTSKFIRFDQYGLYGIQGYSNFDPTLADENGLLGEDKIKEYSDFSLTWSGFKIRSRNSGKGYISITSENDFQLFGANGEERIKIGALDINSTQYGIRIKDEDSNVVMETDSTGSLWLRNRLNVETSDDGTTTGVGIGKLGNIVDDITGHGGRVIDANNTFVVYEDGHMVAASGSFKGYIEATDGIFNGKINATGGKIGNMDIETMEDLFTQATYKIVIESDSGTTFKNGEGIKTLTAQLFEGETEITSNLTYQWYKDNVVIDGTNKKTIEVAAGDLDKTTGSSVYSCVITYNESEEE